jgi:hypothetical protein
MECPKCQNSVRWEGAGVIYCYECKKHFFLNKEGEWEEMEF